MVSGNMVLAGKQEVRKQEVRNKYMVTQGYSHSFNNVVMREMSCSIHSVIAAEKENTV